jgi:hypothetical protein
VQTNPNAPGQRRVLFKEGAKRRMLQEKENIERW